MLLRNAWYIGAWADELGDKPLARRICGDPVVLFRDGSGKAAALADRQIVLIIDQLEELVMQKAFRVNGAEAQPQKSAKPPEAAPADTSAPDKGPAKSL